MLFNSAASIQGADTNEPQNFALDSMGYYFTIEILNRIYNDSLLDPESADYKKMHGEVSNAVSFYFRLGLKAKLCVSKYDGLEKSYHCDSVFLEFSLLMNSSCLQLLLFLLIFS